jgi:hypothetical protein
MSFVMVPVWLAQADITPQALRVWVILGSYGTYNVASGTYESIFPSVASAAERAGICESAFQKAVRELVKVGAVERIARYATNGGQLTNVYRMKMGTFVPPSRNVDVGEGPDFGDGGGADSSPGGGVHPSTRGVDGCTPNQEPLTKNQETKNFPEPTVPAGGGDTPPTAQTILKTFIDACTTHGVTLTPRIKGMYARKFKELLDGGVPHSLIMEALRLSWRKKTVDRVQLLDNYLIEVQTGPAAPRFQSVQERREEKLQESKSVMRMATEAVVAQGGRSNDFKAIQKMMDMIRSTIPGQMAIGAV